MNDTTKQPQDGLNLIDKIFYINLSHRTDRNMHFIDQMKNTILIQKGLNGLTL